MPTPKPLIAGNWKMNGLRASKGEFEAMIAGATPELVGRADLLVCPPVTLLTIFADFAAGSPIAVGAQDTHTETFGAYTGFLSAEMLADAGASAVIVGHSERRAILDETDAMVHAKTLAAWRAGLAAIICVGETRAERDAGTAVSVVERQLAHSVPDGATDDRLVIAYEPIWAIGTGHTPTSADIEYMHGHIRDLLVSRFGVEGRGTRILYGGSLKPSNAKDILAIPNVDGGLIGGASLKAADFLAIADAVPAR